MFSGLILLDELLVKELGDVEIGRYLILVLQWTFVVWMGSSKWAELGGYLIDGSSKDQVLEYPEEQLLSIGGWVLGMMIRLFHQQCLWVSCISSDWHGKWLPVSTCLSQLIWHQKAVYSFIKALDNVSRGSHNSCSRWSAGLIPIPWLVPISWLVLIPQHT